MIMEPECRSLHFRLEQEPESIFQARAGVYIKVCAGVNQIFKKPIKIFVTMLAVVKQNGIN